MMRWSFEAVFGPLRLLSNVHNSSIVYSKVTSPLPICFSITLAFRSFYITCFLILTRCLPIPPLPPLLPLPSLCRSLPLLSSFPRPNHPHPRPPSALAFGTTPLSGLQSWRLPLPYRFVSLKIWETSRRILVGHPRCPPPPCGLETGSILPRVSPTLGKARTTPHMSLLS